MPAIILHPIILDDAPDWSARLEPCVPRVFGSDVCHVHDACLLDSIVLVQIVCDPDRDFVGSFHRAQLL